MKKLLPIMWLAIVAMICFTVWVLVRPHKIKPSDLGLITKYELDEARADLVREQDKYHKVLIGKDAEYDVLHRKAVDIQSELNATKQRDPTVVTHLIEGLRHSDASVRTFAAVGLGIFGPDAESAIKALREAEKDDDPDVANSAAIALKKVSNDPVARSEGN